MPTSCSKAKFPPLTKPESMRNVYFGAWMMLTENAFNEVIKLMYWPIVFRPNLLIACVSFHFISREPITYFQELCLRSINFSVSCLTPKSLIAERGLDRDVIGQYRLLHGGTLAAVQIVAALTMMPPPFHGMTELLSRLCQLQLCPIRRRSVDRLGRGLVQKTNL